jgi:hypothetical protein
MEATLFSVQSKIRGSQQYFQSLSYKVKSMIEQFSKERSLSHSNWYVTLFYNKEQALAHSSLNILYKDFIVKNELKSKRTEPFGSFIYSSVV